MKLIAIGPATQVYSPDPAVKTVSPSRELVPVRQEARRDYATILADKAGTTARGSLVDLLA